MTVLAKQRSARKGMPLSLHVVEPTQGYMPCKAAALSGKRACADTIFNGGVLAFQLPSSVKNGALDASQLPLQRLFPDPVDQFAPYSPVAPRGIVIGGPQPALFVADAMGAQVVVVAAKPPYAFLGALPARPLLPRQMCTHYLADQMLSGGLCRLMPNPGR